MNHWKNYLNEYREAHGCAPAYITETMGCQMNERDSETIAGLLCEMGYAPTASRADAAVIVVNTCNVRENADNRFFGMLGQIKKLKEARPLTVTAVCGCMMQQQHIVDAIKAKYPWVDVIFGTHNIHEFPMLLRSAVLERTKAVLVRDEGGDIVEGLPARREFPFRAYVNIMYGCDNCCTYCIVPYTRGRERSRRPAAIEHEVLGLAANGAKEITLLGQNVNSYRGCDARRDDGRSNSDEPGDALDFPGLIGKLNAIDGIARIRFMTSHPKDLSQRLIDAYRTCEKLCKAIHLPVQSGSSRVLARMNRRYTKEDYIERIDRLRAASQGIAITTDFIVGFPGETEADFEDTMDLIERVRFDSAFTFLYSPRKGTPAASYADTVPEEDKHRRFIRMVERLNAITAEKNRAYLGGTETVLAEGPSKTDPSMMTGRTDAGKVVNFRAPAELAGHMLPVRITGVRTFSLYGEPATGALTSSPKTSNTVC
ncbi:MAG: tRNA (N6-isopentenyl adenosine(37)-C2)-methylthiotransferase MiaB [Clostridiales Family XIII bacterium]|jgi:tRNA-2-methylthio-N6-dimethylallyladenosine synthase|nr:tRNA (N6-isopentenyl adenosine(37)-C2)-methylthiotransferase MiaB [Clostridiales Family XIII bacterium]